MLSPVNVFTCRKIHLTCSFSTTLSFSSFYRFLGTRWWLDYFSFVTLFFKINSLKHPVSFAAIWTSKKVASLLFFHHHVNERLYWCFPPSCPLRWLNLPGDAKHQLCANQKPFAFGWLKSLSCPDWLCLVFTKSKPSAHYIPFTVSCNFNPSD